MTSVRWGDLTREELAEAVERDPLVLLPLGCTEQHALHLPVDTDTYQAQRLAEDGAALAAERDGTDVLVLPALPYGPASEHYGLPGTISLPNEVYLPLVKSIVWSAVELGFRRIAVLRGCGGHWVVPGALWDLKAEAARAGRELVLRLLEVADGWAEVQEELLPGGSGGHAATMETALALAERASLVRLDRLRSPQTELLRERYRQGGEIFLFAEMTDTGALGAAEPATVESGRAAWAALIERFADRLRELDQQDRLLGRR